MEARNDFGQTLRGLLLLGIFVVLPVTAAVFPSVCRLAWPEAYDGGPAAAEHSRSKSADEAASAPPMSLGMTNRDTKFQAQGRSAPILAEPGSAGMAEGWGDEGLQRNDGGSDSAVQAIATPGRAAESSPAGYAPRHNSVEEGLRPGYRSPSYETSVEGWPDRNSVGPGYVPPGTRQTSFGEPPRVSVTNSSETATPNPGLPTTDLEQRLQSLGAVYYRMEKWGADGRLYRFYCDTAVAGQPGMVRHWEAVAEHPESAMLQVLSQIEAAQAGQGM